MRQLLTDLFRQLHDRNSWTFGNVIAVLGVVSGIIIALAPIYQKRRRQRLIERNVGAEYIQESDIKRAARNYVRPDCSDVDPTREEEPRHAIGAKKDLFDAVDKAIHDSVRSHVLLLGDSGMGKSEFTLAYYARNRRLPRRKRQQLAVIPLYRPNALAKIDKIDNKKNTVL